MSFHVGFKLVVRNKRRFVVVMSGLILAISIIGALFLVASNQSHEMGVSYLHTFRQPIHLSQTANSLNMTEYDALDELILEADALGTDVVEDVIHELRVTSYSPTSFMVTYFFTKNQTINWTGFVFNSTAFQNFEFVVEDQFDGYDETGPEQMLVGRVPAAPKEIMVSDLIATGFNITINDNVSICNEETEQMVPGFKVVGIVSGSSHTNEEIFIQYPDLVTLHGAIGESDFVYISYYGWSILHVQIDLSSATIFNVNEIVEKVSLLGSRIETGLAYNGYSYLVTNDMQALAMAGFMITVFLIIYMLLMVVMLLPAILLAGYISKTIALDMFERRATEFGQFRSRGFS
ncbi:MAG: hypothetical protein JW839_21845, partial [Candidatus Lokiarchaeota archaeon]|nr:hypothetical protein [Candidatus Lokiarchaeota archaeon]